jgi:hypothetical protein
MTDDRTNVGHPSSGRRAPIANQAKQEEMNIIASHRHAALIPEKKTLKRLEELRALAAPATALVGRAVEILQGDRGLAVLALDALNALAKELVDERARRRPAAEVIGETVRKSMKVDPPGTALPYLKSAARMLNQIVAGTRVVPSASAEWIEGARVVDEFKVEKRDGGAQLVARASSMEDKSADTVLKAVHELLREHGFDGVTVRLDVSPRANARIHEAKDALAGVLAQAAVPVAFPRSPEDVVRRCREFKVETRGGRDVVVGRVYSTEGVTQMRILAAMRELLRRRGFEDIAVRIELLQ